MSLKNIKLNNFSVNNGKKRTIFIILLFLLCSLAAYGAYSNFHITDSVGNNVFIVDENAKKKNDNKINKDELIN